MSEERSMIICPSRLEEEAYKKNFEVLIYDLKRALKKYNSKAGEKVCLRVETNFIPFIMDGKIVGGLY